MVRTEKTQAAALVYVVLAGLLIFVPVPLEKVGICEGCTFWARLAYPFFHANFLHYVINSWALLSVVFVYDITPGRMLACYIASALVPVGLLNLTVPTVGCSGVMYGLFGSLSLSVRRKWTWQVWWLGFIIVGFFMGGVNSWVHLWCYVWGVVIALLNMEVPIK